MMKRTADDIAVTTHRTGRPFRASGNVAEMSATMTADERCEFIAAIGPEVVRDLHDDYDYLHALHRGSYGGVVYDARKRLGMSHSMFNAYILACRAYIWPEQFGR